MGNKELRSVPGTGSRRAYSRPSVTRHEVHEVVRGGGSGELDGFDARQFITPGSGRPNPAADPPTPQKG